MDDIRVFEAKRLGIYSCSTDSSLQTAARQMSDEDINSLVVVDGSGYLEGVISRTDLLRASLENASWAAEPVGNWMSTDVVTVSLTDYLEHVAELILEKHVDHVVAVREEEGKKMPLAVISSADLVYHMSRERA